MQLTSYAGVAFSTLGVTCSLDTASPGPSRNVPAASRSGADPIAPGVEQNTQTIVALFSSAVGSSHYVEINFSKLFALLNPGDPTARTLAGTILTTGPSTYTTVETAAYVGNWRYRGQNQIEVEFIVTTPGWRATAATTLKAAGVVTANGSFANLNTGLRDIAPTVTVYWDGSQRASTTATFGHKHRLGTGQTITNIGTEPLRNQPYQLGPINTAALVTAGQLQADGDDLRIYCEGKELRRNLIAINTPATFVWVVLPDIMPGQAVTLDILINNPSATNPPTLTYASDPPLPAMDISGTSFLPGGASVSTISYTGPSWDMGQWSGATVLVVNSAGTGAHGQMRQVAVSSSGSLTVSPNFTTAPLTTDTIVVLKSGLNGTGRIATGTSGDAAVLLDSSNTLDQSWIGSTIEIIAGTGAGQRKTITSISPTQIRVTPFWGPNPTSTSVYRVYKANGARVWDIRTSAKSTPHKGLWALNKSAAPPTGVNFDAPGSWYRFTYHRNQDAYSQPRYASTLVGVGDYDHTSTPYIQRARKGKGGTQKEVGVADAIGVFSPFPIRAAEFGYAIRNAKKNGSGSPGEGMCEALFMVQEAGGESWSTFLSDKAVNNSLALVAQAVYDLTSYGSCNRLAWALVPNGTDEIPENDNNTALLTTSSNTVMIRLIVDPATAITESLDWIASPPSAVAVYDVDLLIRTGGAGATRPYHQIRIGGTDRRIFLAATDERIAIDCETHVVSLTTDAGAFIRRIPYVLQPQEVVTDADGSALTLVAARWLPIPPSAIDSANIYVTDPSGAGWGQVGLSVTGTGGYWT